MISIFALILLPQLSLATVSDCGEYEVRGIVRTKQVGHEIVINEKTMSELNISLPISEMLKLAPYVDRPMTAIILLNKKFDGTKGTSDKIISIKDRIPDPLKPDDTGLILVKKESCRN
jgi:hypothetical protein